MEFYLIILVILFVTAISDLVVGVANDAVNFLNSAVGSKAGSRHTIMIVASLGVLFGTTFSSGMMEIARKGIFNPEFFVFHEVMIIFLAVMLTDVLLLDLYNTFGLPTSTTVSIVFEILGGSVALAMIKVISAGSGIGNIFSYINTANVITIISGIGLSIVFSFFFGIIIQFISRLIFTFNYDKTFKRYGAIYCALALTVITYFILVKGAKGSSILSTENTTWVMTHMKEILLVNFLACLGIIQLIISFTKVKVLCIIVLIGTFALALSFAANDLVNFIGAPLAGLSAYKIGFAHMGNGLENLNMAGLKAPVRANTLILLLSGAVMVVTLWISKKARSVTKTEVSLGRQSEGAERFESSALARGLVRMGIAFFEILKKMIPVFIQRKISERIDPDKFKPITAKDGEKPAFDLLRAAVNLMVASALISFGTSVKLPLSTTFVTFMVAMSTSLADRSWGRESAVYRVNGVLTVIGGWFVTAFMAFSTCFIFSLFIFYVKLPAIILLLVFGLFFLYRSTRIHKKREAAFERQDRYRTLELSGSDAIAQLSTKISKFLNQVSEVVDQCFDALIHNHRKKLKQLRKQTKTLGAEVDEVIDDLLLHMKNSSDEEKFATPQYAHIIGALEIIIANLNSLATKNFMHIDNNHQPPDPSQAEELKEVNQLLNNTIKKSVKAIKDTRTSDLGTLAKLLMQMTKTVQKFDRNQIRRVKTGKSGSRQSLLFVGNLTRAERIAEQTVNLIKYCHDIK